MHPYHIQNPRIEFEERLGDYDESDSGGTEGYVFKVRINSQPFALKMFKFFDAREERNQFSDIQHNKYLNIIQHDKQNSDTDSEELNSDTDSKRQKANRDFEGHIDPFYTECRAYGRINEFYDNSIPNEYRKDIQGLSDVTPRRSNKQVIAAQCYDYLFLSAEHEEYLEKNHNIVEWNRQEDDEGKPIRALVKQLIETKGSLNKEKRPNIRRMRDNLWTLHGIGVYPRDNFARNYRGGLLLDFGRSFTIPHYAIRVLPRWLVVAEINGDLEEFDEMMIDELRIKTSIKAVRSKRNARARLKKPSGSPQEFYKLDESGKNGRLV